MERANLSALEVEDEKSFRHVAEYVALKDVVARATTPFLVPARAEDLTWDRALFLNLTFYETSEPTDILCERAIPADVVAHAAWHRVCAAGLDADGAREHVEAGFFGEAVASAFDLYLVGRLLGHAPDSSFLNTQVPAMTDVVQGAGLSDEEVERMLEGISKAPEHAFEDLRTLLFEVLCALSLADDAAAAHATFERFKGHRFYSLLHHYELSNWILAARAPKPAGLVDPSGDRAHKMKPIEAHQALRKLAPEQSLSWLMDRWVHRVAPRSQF